MKRLSNGSAFERAIEQTVEAYAVAGLCKLEKVEPPTRVLRLPGRAPMVVQLKNPFLDFIGTWTELGGKTLIIEAKSTEEPTLKIQEKNGIKLKQLQNAIAWETSGAAVAFLWRYQAETRLITPSMVVTQLKTRKSLRWIDAHPVQQGKGFIFLDFLALLRRIHKTKPTP